MKRILNYTLLLLFIMLGATVNGQVLTDDDDPNGGGGELDGVSCKNKDYQFKIEYEEDKFFFSGKTAFVCTANLPLEVVIVEAQSEQNPNPPPIMPNEIRWSKNGAPAPSNINLLKIKEEDFANNVSEVEVKVVFSFPQEGVTELKFTLKKNGVEFTERSKIYAYDDNKIEPYIGEYGGNVNEERNVPWNFLLMNGAAETLNAKIKKKKGIYAVPSITAPGVNWLNIAPDQIAPNRDADISFDTNLLMEDRVIEVHTCDKKPELFLYAGGLKTINIEVFQVCESDDDMRLIPHLATAPNANPMAVCISPGPDGTLDLERDPLFYISQGDVYDAMTHTIRAGEGGVCDARMFREPDNPGGPAGPAGPATISNCTPVGNFAQNHLGNLNTLSSQVGLRYQAVFSGMIGVNFDVRSDNGVISDGQERAFLRVGIEHIVGNNVPANTVFTYLISDLGTKPNPNPDPSDPATNTFTVAGEATNFGSSMLSLDVVDADHTTWFHEIGHAFGGLRHPDDRNEDGTPAEHFLADDKINFMYSKGGTVRTNKVRRYQFGRIRSGQ